MGKARFFALCLVAACSPHVSHDGPDAGGGVDSGVAGCNTSNCSGVCVTDLGCVACDPSAGNTCNGADVVACNSDGSFGSVISTCGEGTQCSAGGCSRACTADGVDLVYVVDEQNDFMSFDPRKLPGDPFTLIGTLSCPTTGGSIQNPPGAVTPFSMAVDRNGVAWVEYTSGEIFNVSLTDATCTASGYTPRAGGMDLFGMGFVTDAVMADTEKLFQAGGGDAAEPNGKLSVIDPANGNLTPTQLGTLSESSDFSPELTGTNEAKLYGFFPVISSGPSYVQEIDRASGNPVGNQFPLGTTGLGQNIRDWAFAQWGGVFYVFVTTDDGTGVLNSTVRSVDRATGTYTVVLQNLPYNIDGAGVSTCAPSVLQ